MGWDSNWDFFPSPKAPTAMREAALQRIHARHRRPRRNSISNKLQSIPFQKGTHPGSYIAWVMVASLWVGWSERPHQSLTLVINAQRNR